MKDLSLFSIERLELSFAPKPWAFAEERKEEIAAFFAEFKRQKPAVWNGRVLLMHRYEVSDSIFRGEYFETDYASFLAWRRGNNPPADVHDCFGAGAVVSADNAVLLGVMGEHTANAGRIYFPAGTPDPSDVVDGTVNLDASIARELKEETGCDVNEFTIEPGWTTVIDGGLIVQIRILRSKDTAGTLRARMLAHLSSEKRPELSDIRIVRGKNDFDPAMPPFVIAFLERLFAKD